MKKSSINWYILFISFFFCCLSACSSSQTEKPAEKANTNDIHPPREMNKDSAYKMNEQHKANIEAQLANLIKKEIIFAGMLSVNEEVKQKWKKAIVYEDSLKRILRIKLMPHEGISERSEEYYYNDDLMFMVFIADKGAKTDGKDEGKPGKELHFFGNKLIKYDDKSGDREDIDMATEMKLYEAQLPIEASFFLKVAQLNKKF